MVRFDDVGEDQVNVGIPDGKFSLRRLLKYVGPGYLVAIAYIDPGNFGADINAGATYQYKLLWMLLSATLMGLLVQFLASKLGLVAKKDLAQQCRISYAKPLNIVLWIMAEVGVIASDIPEILGSAYALEFLFGIPLVWGVIITALDTLLILFLQNFNIRYLEAVIGFFLLMICFCFVYELFEADVDPIGIVEGFIPFYGTRAIVKHETEGGSLSGYGVAAVGLLGSVVMPHNLFLHSALVKTRKVHRTVFGVSEAMLYNLIECSGALFGSFIINLCVISVSAAVFYYNADAGINDAPQLLQSLGKAAPIVFGIALLLSGQSSTITGTYAGQFVMEGFLGLKIAMWKRNLITRSVAIVPSLLVAIFYGDSGSETLVVWSQIILSIQLPFALLPLLKMTYAEKIMGQFRNGIPLQVVGSIIGLIVTGANVMLIGFSFIDFLDLSTLLGKALLLVIIAVGVLYMGFLLYLAFVPVDKNSVTPVFPDSLPDPEAELDQVVDDDYPEYIGTTGVLDDTIKHRSVAEEEDIDFSKEHSIN